MAVVVKKCVVVQSGCSCTVLARLLTGVSLHYKLFIELYDQLFFWLSVTGQLVKR